MLFPNIEDIAQREVITISCEATVRDAMLKMAENNIRTIIILDGKAKRYGILTADNLIHFRLKRFNFNTPLAKISYEEVPQAPADTNVLDALRLIKNAPGYLCMVDGLGELLGIVSHTDIISSMDPQIIIEEQQICEMFPKTVLIAVSPTDTTLEAITRMNESHVDCVIIEVDKIPTGILTTRDTIRLFSAGMDLDEPVGTYMSSPLFTIKKNTSIKSAMDIFSRKHFRRLVVVDSDQAIIGIITQEEMLARVYSKWGEMVRQQHWELQEINNLLEERAAQLEKQAMTDKLTGIYNRAKFEDALEIEISRVERYQNTGFGLILLDIDKFKDINDSFGHQIGDNALIEVSGHISRSIRLLDIFARWGGDEFVILLPQTTLEQTIHTAEKLRIVLADIAIENGPAEITCSFGVSRLQPDDTLESLISRVDMALYKAKNKGRDRIETHEQ